MIEHVNTKQEEYKPEKDLDRQKKEVNNKYIKKYNIINVKLIVRGNKRNFKR